MRRRFTTTRLIVKALHRELSDPERGAAMRASVNVTSGVALWRTRAARSRSEFVIFPLRIVNKTVARGAARPGCEPFALGRAKHPPPQCLMCRKTSDGWVCGRQYWIGKWSWLPPEAQAAVNLRSLNERLLVAMPGPLPPGSENSECGTSDPPPLFP